MKIDKAVEFLEVEGASPQIHKRPNPIFLRLAPLMAVTMLPMMMMAVMLMPFLLIMVMMVVTFMLFVLIMVMMVMVMIGFIFRLYLI